MKKLLAVLTLASIFVACEQKKKIVDNDKERLEKVCDTFMQYSAKANSRKLFNF